MKRRGPGQPPKPDGKHRIVGVRFSPEEYARLKAAADAEVLSASDFVRAAVAAAISAREPAD